VLSKDTITPKLRLKFAKARLRPTRDEKLTKRTGDKLIAAVPGECEESVVRASISRAYRPESYIHGSPSILGNRSGASFIAAIAESVKDLW
jgi:hypothetical protein